MRNFEIIVLIVCPCLAEIQSSYQLTHPSKKKKKKKANDTHTKKKPTQEEINKVITIYKKRRIHLKAKKTLSVASGFTTITLSV